MKQTKLSIRIKRMQDHQLIEAHSKQVSIKETEEKINKLKLKEAYCEELKKQKEQRFQQIKKDAIEKQQKDDGLNIYESDQFKNKMTELSKKQINPNQKSAPTAMD